MAALREPIDGQRDDRPALAERITRTGQTADGSPPGRGLRVPATAGDATMTARTGGAVANLPEPARRLAGASLAPSAARAYSPHPRPD